MNKVEGINDQFSLNIGGKHVNIDIDRVLHPIATAEWCCAARALVNIFGGSAVVQAGRDRFIRWSKAKRRHPRFDTIRPITDKQRRTMQKKLNLIQFGRK